MENVNIRRFNEKGSETVTISVEEAEMQIEEAMRQGYLVVDEDAGERITSIGESQNILIVVPLAGG